MLIPLFRVQRCKPENSGCRSYQLTPRAVREDLGAPAPATWSRPWCTWSMIGQYVDQRASSVWVLNIHTHTDFHTLTRTHARTHAHWLTHARTHTHARARTHAPTLTHARIHTRASERQRQRQITNHCWCCHSRQVFFACNVVHLSELDSQSRRSLPLLRKRIMYFEKSQIKGLKQGWGTKQLEIN